MKKNQINWNHSAESLSEALGLTDEQRDNVISRVKNNVDREETISKAAEDVIGEYEDDPAKQAFGLLLLEQAEEMKAMTKLASFAGDGGDDLDD